MVGSWGQRCSSIRLAAVRDVPRWSHQGSPSCSPRTPATPPWSSRSPHRAREAESHCFRSWCRFRACCFVGPIRCVTPICIFILNCLGFYIRVSQTRNYIDGTKSSDPTSSRYTSPPRMASLGNTKDGGWEDANLLHRFHVPRLINARTHLPVGHVFHEIGLLFEKLGSEEVAPGRGGTRAQ